MPTTPPPEPPARTADEVDAEIRALLTRTGGWLWGPTRDEYQQLRDEWVEAVRAEITAAA